MRFQDSIERTSEGIAMTSAEARRAYAPQIATFNIQVQDLRWLPAVLDLLMPEQPVQ
jgi:hypothetical protein